LIYHGTERASFHAVISHMQRVFLLCHFFFFNVTAPTEVYTLSLHDALPIYRAGRLLVFGFEVLSDDAILLDGGARERIATARVRSEEHTSELQSRFELVCRPLLEKKKS